MNKRIKEVRKTFGLTQEQFGLKIGLTGAALSKIESGTNNPTGQTIVSICREFGVSEVWLRTGIGEMRPPNTRADELGRAIRELLTDETDSFRTRLLTVLLRFDPDGPEWDILERIVEEVAGENKKSPEP